jgi:hypothetical protein
MLRRAGELIAHPCGCGREDCTLGEHIYDSTRNMSAGLKAANLDPGRRGWRYEEDHDGVVWPIPIGDSTGEAAIESESADPHDEYMRTLVEAAQLAARVIDDVSALRPDRRPEVPGESDADEFCRHHMDTIGVWEQRHRGDECRVCYDFRRQWQMLPPEPLLRARHEGRRWTDRMVAEAVRHERARRKAKKKGRRKAS